MTTRAQTLGFNEIKSLEERRAARRSLGVVEAKSVLGGEDEWRFFYTIKEAVEHSEVWFANEPGGPLIGRQHEGRWVVPFWPHEDVAKLDCKPVPFEFEINPMPLDHWINQELDVECRDDDCLIALCPSDGYAALKTVDEVFSALSNYAKDPEAFWDEHFSSDKFFITQNLKLGPKGRLP